MKDVLVTVNHPAVRNADCGAYISCRVEAIGTLSSLFQFPNAHISICNVNLDMTPKADRGKRDLLNHIVKNLKWSIKER